MLKNIVKPICSLSFWNGDNDAEEEMALNGFPFYVYRQNYSPNIPIRRTQIPKSAFKEDRLSKDVIKKALRLPFRFDETEHFHTAMYIPTMSYASEKIIDGREYAANRGDMVIINYNQTHEMNGEGVYVNIMMKMEMI